MAFHIYTNILDVKNNSQIWVTNFPFLKNVCRISSNSKLISKQFCMVIMPRNHNQFHHFHSQPSFDIFKAKKFIGKSSDPYRTQVDEFR